MLGGGREMIHEKINTFGDRDIGTLASGKMPHFRGAGVAKPGALETKINCKR